MEDLAELIYAFLGNNEALNPFLGGRVFWEIAEQEGDESIYPLCNFSISDDGSKTKDAYGVYYVSFVVWSKSLTEVARIGDRIKEQVSIKKHSWTFEGGEAKYENEYAKAAYRELKFRIRN